MFDSLGTIILLCGEFTKIIVSCANPEKKCWQLLLRCKSGTEFKFSCLCIYLLQCLKGCTLCNIKNVSGLYCNSASCLGWWPWKFLCAMCKCWRLGLCCKVGADIYHAYLYLKFSDVVRFRFLRRYCHII